jgi:predicted CXXCH cytochrome family protein
MTPRHARTAALLLCVLFFPGVAPATPPSFICLTAKCHPSIAEEEFVHGPIGSGMCPLCHDDGGVVDSLPPGHPEVRIGTATEKCLLCHEEVGAMMERGSVHTPVAEGDCVDCHRPHSGDNLFFLIYPPASMEGTRIIAPTCKACHEAEDPSWYDEFHASEEALDCVVCHNAHASSEPYQLTRYVMNVYLRSVLMDAADLTKSGKLAAAAEAYGKALAIFPKDIRTLLRLAHVHELQDAWTDALAQYEKVLALQSDDVETLLKASTAAGKLKGEGAEMTYLKRAVEIEARPGIHARLGEIYRSRKQLQEAVSEFSKAVRIDPKYLPARRQLAEVYESMGMVRDAAEERRLIQELKEE